MKYTASVVAFSLLALQEMALAFSVPKVASVRSNSMRLSSSPGASDIEALRAAAAKAREEADRLSEQLGKTKPQEVPKEPKKSTEEVKAALPSIISEKDLSKQAAAWAELKDSNSITAFGSANLRSFEVTLKMLEMRTGLTPDTLGMTNELTEVSLDDFKYATLYVAGGCTVLGIASLALLPPNVGATFCYIFALIPILFLGIGSTAPAVIANAIALIKGEDSAETATGVSSVERRTRHEAAHFCCGYWCGLPVSSYEVQENGVCQVEFAVSSTKYSPTEVAALAVTAMSGLVGEALKWKNAVGASEDLMLLDQVFRRSDDFIGSKAQQDLTRWGALTAALLIRQNNEKYEKIVEAFGRQAPLEECIDILES